MVGHVQIIREEKLPEVVGALDLLPSRLALGKHWKQKSRQNANDGNYNQQLDEREGPPRLRLIRWCV
jgi:hypothetical protein